MNSSKIELIPLNGKKMKITLNRTIIHFMSEGQYKLNNHHKVIYLPSLDKGSFHFVLEKTAENEFLIKSKSATPFKLNGNLVFEAFFSKGDYAYLGYNKLYFPRVNEVNKKEFENLEKISKSDRPIILKGETGTGKTTLARKIHDISEVTGCFVHLNLSAFANNLLESELFGHIRGAFTGANRDKTGAFKEANYGTLFLDEVDSLPIEIQTKLLLFLDDQKIRPVGGSKITKLKTRIIFSTGSDLKTLVGKGLMRKDFYFRLKSGFQINLSPLRENPQKIQEVCYRFEKKYNVKLEDNLVEFYMTRRWEGNLRELTGHLLSKLVFKRHKNLFFDDLDKSLMEKEQEFFKTLISENQFLPLKEVTKNYVDFAYSQIKDLSFLSEVLEVSPTTLRKKIGLLKAS